MNHDGAIDYADVSIALDHFGDTTNNGLFPDTCDDIARNVFLLDAALVAICLYIVVQLNFLLIPPLCAFVFGDFFQILTIGFIEGGCIFCSVGNFVDPGYCP